MHHSSQTTNRPNESAVRHRLAMMWFANSYPHYARKNGTVSQSDTVPVEYLPPYPNPWYWPKNTPNTKQVQSNKRLTATEATRAATASPTNIEPIIYPSWLEFWQGKPPEYPLPEIPYVIIPDIAPSNFMDVFRETQGLRLPRKQDLKSQRAPIVQRNDVSTVQGLTEYRAANSTIPWVIEKHTSSEPQATTVTVNTTKENSATLKTINSVPVETSNIKQYRVVGKKGEEILVPVDETGATIRVVDYDGHPIELPKFTGDIVTFNVGTDGGRIEIEISKDSNHGELGTTIITNGVYDFRYYRDTIIEYAEEEIIAPESPVERIPFSQEFQNYYEEICCAGLNPEDGYLEAVVIIKNQEGYSGGLCTPGSFVSVGFWLSEPSMTEGLTPDDRPPVWEGSLDMRKGERFIGEANVAVYDIPRFIGKTNHVNKPPADRNKVEDNWWYPEYMSGYLHYTVRVKLSDEDLKYVRKCSELPSPRLPRLHCVLQWNRVVTRWNAGGYLVAWGDVKLFDVQFPVSRSKGVWKYIPRPAGESQVFPVHAVNLTNGEVLLFSGSAFTFADAPNNPDPYYGDVGIFNPTTGKIRPIDNPHKAQEAIEHDLFCSGHSILPNGNIFISGGTTKEEIDDEKDFHASHWPGNKKVTEFLTEDLYTNKNPLWKSLADMGGGRWYPSTLVLGDGNIFIMDGHPEETDETRHNNFDVEIYNSSTLKIDFFAPNINPSNSIGIPLNNNDKPYPGIYPRIHLLPIYSKNTENIGYVFCASIINSYVDSSGTRVDKKYTSSYWQPKNPTTTFHGIFYQEDVDSFSNNKNYHVQDELGTSVLLPLFPPYKPDDCSLLYMTIANCYQCYPFSKDESKQLWKDIGRAHSDIRRLFPDSVLLADGRVLFVNGTHPTDSDFATKPSGVYDDQVAKYIDYGELEGEIYDPILKTWETIDKQKIPRGYHSFAILLYDGSVLVGGSHRYFASKALKETESPWLNRELSLEVYYPDYCFKGRRPVFKLDTVQFEYGKQYRVELIDEWKYDDILASGDKGKVALVRCYSVTHGFGFDQRYVVLETQPSNWSNTDIWITIPNNSSILPPGFYMLFVVNNLGIPSLSQTINVKLP